MDVKNQELVTNTWDHPESIIYEMVTLNDIQLLMAVIEESDAFTWSHSVKVANYAYMISEMLCLSNEQRNNIYIGALLHDIGKVDIPEMILKKAGKLTPDEWAIMRTHPEIGFNFLKDNERLMMRGIPEVVLHHHERYDGKGYPDGLAGEDISLATRIVTIADCYDAMTSNRVYCKAKEKAMAAKELLNNAYTQFDPKIARVFVDFILSDSPLFSPPHHLQKILFLEKQKSS
jgi:HD-GYP domain-containing protein (c-di-GMP phosphodiesterase class II)